MNRTSGPVALIGGWVHSLPCLPVDVRLIELIGKPRPVVTIVPFASSTRLMPQAYDVGRRFWVELNAEVRALPVWDEGGTPGPEELAGTDILVLTGGHPPKLHTRLAEPRIRNAIIEFWKQGMAVSGSSAGCMEICEWSLKAGPLTPLRIVPGLGLLKNSLSLPHFNRYGISTWSRWLSKLRELTVIGVDERTGFIGFGDSFEVVGLGAVTIIKDGTARRYESGSRLELDLSAPEELHPRDDVHPLILPSDLRTIESTGPVFD